ncbi:MAG: ABC transporter permease, partial [Cyclobacteriaceae bacterium]
MKRRSLFSAINIIGLGVGLASVLVIIAYVRDELSYDKFHSKHDRIYRVTLDWLDNGRIAHLAAVEPPLSEGLSGKLSSVEMF